MGMCVANPTPPRKFPCNHCLPLPSHMKIKYAIIKIIGSESDHLNVLHGMECHVCLHQLSKYSTHIPTSITHTICMDLYHV
jgi:hypothetical protein